VLPVVVLNPYIAGGLFADYPLRGRYHLIPKNPGVADADHLDLLTQTTAPALTPAGPRPDNPADTTRIQANTFIIEMPASAQVESVVDHQ
jgi:hypothetical protein